MKVLALLVLLLTGCASIPNYEVCDFEAIVNEWALLRNKWLGVIKALDQKQWHLTNIVKLRVAGMEDANL